MKRKVKILKTQDFFFFPKQINKGWEESKSRHIRQQIIISNNTGSSCLDEVIYERKAIPRSD